MMERINIVFYYGLFLTLSNSFVDAVTEDDVKECGSYIFGRVLCTSVRSFYRECIVPGATSIDLIKLHQNFTQEPCVFKDTFGFRGNAVWVNKGCSGEFYVCYEGERVSTDYPVLTVTVSPPPTGKPPPDNDVVSGSTLGGSGDVLLYVIIVIAVVVIVGIGLLIGCLVKRRQHRDRSKRLAEKRQANIEERAYKNQIEENDINILPTATRSLSMESVRAGSSIKGNNTYVSYDREGSVCSSQSSMSEFTSVSAQTIGGTDNFRSTQGASILERSRKNNSLTDIRSVGRIYSEVIPVSKQNRSDRNSLSSLESIREICNRYQMVDIPIERRYKKKSETKNKYNTVGFSESRAGSRSRVSSPKSGTMTLPINRKKTRALVHVNPPHVPNVDSSSNVNSTYIKPLDQHYHDPDTLNLSRDNYFDNYTENSTINSHNNALSTEADEVYAVVNKPTEIKDSVEHIPIYATVTKSCLKTQRNSESPNGGCSVSFKESEKPSKESNNNIYTLYGKPFTYLSSFRPIEINTSNKPSKDLALDLKATTC